MTRCVQCGRDAREAELRPLPLPLRIVLWPLTGPDHEISGSYCRFCRAFYSGVLTVLLLGMLALSAYFG